MRTPNNIRDLTGMVFGKLTVVCFLSRSKWSTWWKCKCECGVFVATSTSTLTSGKKVRCGVCYRSQTTTHGQAPAGGPTKEYMIWCTMIQRCTNPKCKYFKDYGGRGIYVCWRWMQSFQNFYDDMGPKPRGRSLDRKDNDAGYSKGNCRWATASEQARNKRGRCV